MIPFWEGVHILLEFQVWLLYTFRPAEKLQSLLHSSKPSRVTFGIATHAFLPKVVQSRYRSDFGATRLQKSWPRHHFSASTRFVFTRLSYLITPYCPSTSYLERASTFLFEFFCWNQGYWIRGCRNRNQSEASISPKTGFSHKGFELSQKMW